MARACSVNDYYIKGLKSNGIEDYYRKELTYTELIDVLGIPYFSNGYRQQQLRELDKLFYIHNVDGKYIITREKKAHEVPIDHRSMNRYQEMEQFDIPYPMRNDSGWYAVEYKGQIVCVAHSGNYRRTYLDATRGKGKAAKWMNQTEAKFYAIRGKDDTRKSDEYKLYRGYKNED